MACVDLMEALDRAEAEAFKKGRTFAIYSRSGLFIVEALIKRTGDELEIIAP